MKKLFTFLTMAFFLLPSTLKADEWTETFDDNSGSSYLTAFTCAISGDWTAEQSGQFDLANTYMFSPAATINDDKVGAHITTPVLNTCGTVSFKYAYRYGSGDNVFILQKSTDGVSFTDLDTHVLGANSELNYIDYSFDVDDFSSTVYIRVLSDDQSGHLFIEDFTVTDAVVDLTAPVATFSPIDAAIDFEVFFNIVVSFDEAILATGGAEVTDPASLVEVRETDAAGAVVAFTAMINDDKDEIVITPDADLAFNQLYYVAVKASVLEDASANVADAVQSSTFTTISATTPVMYVDYPAGGEVLSIGEEVHIDWTSRNMGNISIYVSFDAGANWFPIVEDIDPAPGTTNYTIPEDSPASLEGMIRIAEAVDLAFAGTLGDSKIFSILPVISIYDIQSDVVALYEDTVCVISGVVTFIDPGNEYYISDGVGDYSAILVDDGVNTPAVGDSVVIAGTVDEFHDLTNITSLLSFINVASGKTVPAPIDITTGGAVEALEGVIVKLNSAVVMSETSYYGETDVDDGSGVILIDDPYYLATLDLGAKYDITGPLSYSYSKWRVYPGSAADVVLVLSDVATITSDVYTIDDSEHSITAVPALEELAAFKANITPAYGATFEVYEADGTIVATDLATGYKVIVTAEDSHTSKTYTVTKESLSDDATVTSLVYTVDDGAGTIDGILYKSTLTFYEALLIAAPGAAFITYEADGTAEATDLMTGYKLIVTAEDGIATKTYTITVDDGMPGDLIFSEYIEGNVGNNKALEIFNPNDVPVRMDYYQLAQIANGGDTWEYFHVFPVGTVLGSYETHTIINEEVDVLLFDFAKADEILGWPSPVSHNGNDARGLIIVTAVDTTLVDIIGEIGPDPGNGWDVAGITNATKDHTLLRKGTVTEGNTDWASSAGTNADNSEWIVKDVMFFDSLGTHFLVIPEPSDDATLSDLKVDGTSVTGFSPAQLSYYVTLAVGTTDVPVVTATATDDGLATIDVTDATALVGDEAARTTSVLVTAEDGTTEKTYKVVFAVEVSVENSLFNNVKVYPVPAVNKLYMENIEEVQSMTVFDITGAAVMNFNNSGQSTVTLDVASLSSGIYMVRMTSDDTSGVVRFIKE